MKKSVWMSQLEQVLTREGMTNAEKRTVMNFYEEMYQDKHDDGMSEEDIIKEFGFPEDVAQNVRESGEQRENATPITNSAYEADGYVMPSSVTYGESTEHTTTPPTPQSSPAPQRPQPAAKSAPPKQLISGVLSVFLTVAAIALFVLGAVLAISGVATIVCGFIVISFSAGAWLIAFGIGLFLFAVGGLIFYAGLKIIKSVYPSKGGAK